MAEPKDPAGPPADPANPPTDPPADPPEDDDDGDDDDPPADPPADPVKLAADLKKANDRATRRDKLVRDLQAKVATLEAGKDGDKDKPDPVTVANTRLVRAEARTALAAAGVTDKDSQKAVLSVLNLSGVDVASDGEVDADALEDMMEALKKAFGGTAGKRRQSPPLDTRDKSKNTAPADPDKDRYARILGRSRG